ncbi:MAG: hypothetical protein UR39_C0005G0007 [Candidatus Woesebacteria bacterium GW2011_GWA1_33_30]|uniref:Uncharacterized protein n=1 Tax=Candidatus Woesebacteria bacterium GW2011_GWA2_33_28 TaxID=1618561 RepID=A0A0F9ZSL2_9BACT|nr:MAG: hypothetical protein UR38_C0005G0007 [Candidatus Woesebacteria bacterium GW2011_GWA2_33_28]KKP48125.1 MAG: hypothetical protein UR39_C0005G0007 [Candidatus Woesebacteria bacterium GW2011_GWA1_33_30]KKP49367.1 MAG: hypothetical protein UR40_C0006G0007 [Microgenomates group bacterium GW2011_GWC1_33_32]KKP52093.1 MAG: hypothetical protein UR44_C0004G0007 [Candidatus Woesebacteria bacterium GW2011_GWB1_33_38]
MLKSMNTETRQKLISMSNLEFSGNDCYALRCSLYHQATTSISHQQARIKLDNFEFVPPKKNNFRHFNLQETKNYKVLQLQIDIFCLDFIDAYYNWFANQTKQTRTQATENTINIVQ